MDRGGTHAESFFTLSDEYIDQCFTTRGLPGISHNTEDEDDAYPPYDYTNCAETREIDTIPQCVQHELDTLYWCEDIPETMAWLASDPSVLTTSHYSEEDNLDDVGDYPTFSQIKRHPVLRPMAEEAMESELAAFAQKEVYKLKPLPAHVPWSAVIPSHWRFTVKRDKDGRIMRVKARLVAGGDHQVPGRDFQELYASTISLDTVRLIIALACKHDLDLHHLDVDAAFLNAPLNETIYVRQPPWYNDGTNRVWHLIKSMYGLRQAPRDWERHRTHLLGTIGFAKLESEPSVYARPAPDNSITILASYVDDFLIAATPGCAEKVRTDIMSIFTCKDLGPVSSFLGIQVDRDRSQGTIKLSSPRYIRKIVLLMGMQDSKYANTPASHTTVLLPRDPGLLAPDYPYLSAIGRLL
jgi:hypothetical protein